LRLDAVDAILAEIELTGYGMGTGPSKPSIRDLARQARGLLKEEQKRIEHLEAVLYPPDLARARREDA